VEARPTVRRRSAATGRPATAWVARAVVAALVLGVPTSGWWAPAGAQARTATQTAGCDEVVVDDAHVLAHADAVAAAAGQVAETTKALVRVRVVASLDGHDPETHRGLIEAGCPSWSSDGHRDARLLLVVVAPVERKTTVAYGSAWTDRLVSTVGALQRERMDARFKTGDFDTGLTEGLAALGDRLRAGPVAASPSYTVAPIAPTFAPPRRGSDVDGLAVVLFLAVVAMAVGSVAVGGARRLGRGDGFFRYSDDDRRNWWGSGSSGADIFGRGFGSGSSGSGSSGSGSFGSDSFGSDSSSGMGGSDGGSSTSSW
jgi:uncharacterized membrane protein YgcG